MERKNIFIAFAKEDDRIRDLFVGQRKLGRTPYDWTDMSVKNPYDSDWKVAKLFESPEQLWEYAEAVLPPRRKPARPAPPPAPIIPVSALTRKPRQGRAD